jgi:hypothetical protein
MQGVMVFGKIVTSIYSWVASAGPLKSQSFIRNGSDTPKLASAWSECRSLLAGDEQRPRSEHALNRLQAGSYK